MSTTERIHTYWDGYRACRKPRFHKMRRYGDTLECQLCDLSVYRPRGRDFRIVRESLLAGLVLAATLAVVVWVIS